MLPFSRDVSSGCMGYHKISKYMERRYGMIMIALVSSKKEKSGVSSILVHNFEDVFWEDITMLPLEREIEFSIDLLLGIAPISKVPHSMPPYELQELKTQL